MPECRWSKWYQRKNPAPTKTEPVFSDMLAKLRRVITAARFPTVKHTWAQAGLDTAA